MPFQKSKMLKNVILLCHNYLQICHKQTLSFTMTKLRNHMTKRHIPANKICQNKHNSCIVNRKLMTANRIHFA